MAIVTPCWCIDALLFLVCGILYAYIYVARSHSYWERRGVKSVPVRGVFGNFADCIFARKALRDKFHEYYCRGDGEKFIGFYVFGKPFLILRDPAVIKNVLVRDFKNFSNRCVAPHHGDTIGRLNIFSLRNPAWKALRQKLSPVFTSSKLKAMFAQILEIEKDLDCHLKKLIPNDDWHVVEMKELCEKFTTDVIGLTMFGMKLNALNDPSAEFRKEGSKHFRNSYKRYMSLMSMFFFPKLVKWFRLTFFDPDVPTFFKKVIPEAMRARGEFGGKVNDVLDAFLDLRESYKNEDDELHTYFQEDGLVATGIVFFTGGFEPSASAMYLILYELSKQPHIQSRLREELSQALEVAGGEITYDMVMSLPYLDMVVSEGLRKYPLLHFIDREAEEEYTFPDSKVTIEKGTPLIIPMSGLHMDAKYFADPDKFDPERFSAANKRRIPAFCYLPFGEGPRNCIGVRNGQVQTKVGLIHIVSKYQVLPCDETPIPLEYDSYTLFTKSKHNMKLNLRRVPSKLLKTIISVPFNS